MKIPADAFVTQVVKTDTNGVFSYTMPRAGWWGFAALLAGEKVPSPQGKPAEVELGGVMWVKAVDMETKGTDEPAPHPRPLSRKGRGEF